MKFLILILALNVTTLFAADKIHIMTETYPPYNMEVNGELKGIAVDILDAMLDYMKLDQAISDVALTNWSRAYSIALKKKNYMVFSTTRTEQRENLFKWVGPIIKTKIGLMAKKSSQIKLKNLTELNNYQIGAVLKDIGELLVLEAGVNKKNIHSISGENVIELSFIKLDKERIDLFAYELNVAKFQATVKGFDFNNYENVYVLKEAELFFAFNKATSDETIAIWQDAFNAIKKNGLYDKIIAKY